MKLDNVIAKRDTKTVYRDGDKVIKLFGETFSKADILNEALNQSRVEDTNLKVPKILEVTKIDGKWAIIMEYVEGETLDALMKANPDKECEYMEKFVELQLDIHKNQVGLLNKLREKMKRKIAETNLTASNRYELNGRLQGMPRHKKLCHGDFCPKNVIVTPEGEYYVIDWAHATQGNASADVARTYLVFKLQGKDELAEKYLKLFCKKTDTAIQYVQKWLPIVAASQSVKGKPEEFELLSSWCNIVEFE